MDVYQKAAREKMAQHGFIEEAIVDTLNDNNEQWFRSLSKQEGDFHQWLTAEFTRRRWRLELQAPQGPYTNMLDLQVSKLTTPFLNLAFPI